MDIFLICIAFLISSGELYEILKDKKFNVTHTSAAFYKFGIFVILILILNKMA